MDVGELVLAGCVVGRWCLSSFPSASRQASPGTLASAGDPCWESAISGGLICLRREGRLAGETIGRQSNNNVSLCGQAGMLCRVSVPPRVSLPVCLSLCVCLCVCLAATRRRRSEAGSPHQHHTPIASTLSRETAAPNIIADPVIM